MPSTPPTVYLGKAEYDQLLRAGEEPSAVVTRLVREHLAALEKSKPKK